MRDGHSRNPVAKSLYTVVNGNAGTYITSAAWVQIEPSLGHSVDQMEILNTTGGLMKVAIGAPGSEVEQAFYVMPASEPHLVPINIRKGDKISVKAVDPTTIDSDGVIAINWYG